LGRRLVLGKSCWGLAGSLVLRHERRKIPNHSLGPGIVFREPASWSM